MGLRLHRGNSEPSTIFDTNYTTDTQTHDINEFTVSRKTGLVARQTEWNSSWGTAMFCVSDITY